MCQITKYFTMPSLTISETIYFEFDLTAGAFFGDSTQTSKYLLKEVLGRMFPAIYNFSIFSMRDFVGQVATVNCSSNNDLTNILATPLSAASVFNPKLNNTTYYFTFVIILT